MVWYDGLWQVAAAGVAALVARSQFAENREVRRASELAQMDATIAAAAGRKDILEHAYRAHQLRRLQAIHGNRSSGLIGAVMWGFLTFGILTLATSLTPTAPWWVRWTLLAGLFGSFMMAGRHLGQFLYGSRTLFDETGESLEVAMVDARQKFIKANEALPPLPAAPQLPSLSSLGTRAVASWKAKQVRQKRDMVVLVGLLLVGVVIAIQGKDAVDRDLLAWRDAVKWTAWICTIAVALLPVLSGTLRSASGKLRPTWLQLPVYWGGQLAWAAGWILWGPDRFNGWILKGIYEDANATLDTVFVIAASAATMAVLLAYLAVSTRVDRWMLRRRNGKAVTG